MNLETLKETLMRVDKGLLVEELVAVYMKCATIYESKDYESPNSTKTFLEEILKIQVD